VPEDASLDEFAGAGTDGASDDNTADVADEGEDADAGSDVSAAADADDGNDDGADDVVSADDSADDPSPDPAAATYRWSPEGAACPDCGEAVDRQWRDDDRFVCADCKEW
jgi:hypothetical protein